MAIRKLSKRQIQEAEMVNDELYAVVELVREFAEATSLDPRTIQPVTDALYMCDFHGMSEHNWFVLQETLGAVDNRNSFQEALYNLSASTVRFLMETDPLREG